MGFMNKVTIEENTFTKMFLDQLNDYCNIVVYVECD